MREAQQSFNIRTSKDFFHKLEEEYADFQQNPLSARHAINAAMTAWHLHEWLWADKLKGNYKEQKRILGEVIRKKKEQEEQEDDELIRAMLGRCKELSIMQGICNGSKHFRYTAKESLKGDAVAETGVKFARSSFLGSAYAGHMFPGFKGVPYLSVTTASRTSIGFQSVLDTVLAFWSSIFAEC
jgi:hypothetical protein